MKSRYILAFAIVLLVLVPACGNNSNAPGSESATRPQSASSSDDAETTATAAIGTVSNIRTQVYAGAPDNLVLIEGKTALGNDDFVKVADGGKARLEFPGPISLLLYNQSEVDDIKLEYDSNSNPRIINRLIRGGFAGYVEPGNQLTIDLAFGVQVNVLGTNFFALYDEENGYITIGKFDGTLSLSVPSQPTIYMDDAEMIDINADGIVAQHTQIAFTFAQFDLAADSCISPIQGLNILRRDNNLPQAGETAVDVDMQLACGPLPSENIPVTGACETPIGYVKVSSVKLREGPDLRYLSVGEYRENDQFTILGSYQGWFKVEFPGQKRGWLYTDWVTIPQGVDTDQVCKIPFGDLPPTPHREPRCVPSKYVACP